MSATAIKVPARQSVIGKEWVKLFPKQITENYTSSVTFIKQLTMLAVSTITYLKNAFPEDCYNNETFAGLKLKILKEKCVDDMAQFLSSSLQNAFEAIDKKYVHQIALCFYNGDTIPENLIDYHVIEYSYSPEGVFMNMNSKNGNSDQKSMKCSLESVQNKTVLLIRSLFVFVGQNCRDELPVNYDISLWIYYNEDAPEDYQAPGFSEPTGPDPVSSTLRSAVLQGGVLTPYHKFIARSYAQGLDITQESDNTPEVTQDNDFEDEPMEPTLCCPCGKMDAEQLVTCRHCRAQQHAVCVGLIAPVAGHCCADCAEREPSRESTCSMLTGLERRKQECLCIFRRCLVMCCRRVAVTGAELMTKLRLTATSAAKMVRLMHSHHILPAMDPSDLTVPRSINKYYLKLTMQKFFKVNQYDLDRVIAETELSDPVEEALSPIEKITLKETSLGKVTERSALPTTPLKEFSQVEFLNKGISEDLPLSGSHNPVRNVPRPDKTLKRKKIQDEDWTPKLPKLRSAANRKRT